MPVLFSRQAIRIQQRIGNFWAVAIPADILLQCTVPDRLRVLVDPSLRGTDEWNQAMKMLGTQRELEKDRLKAIAKYIDGADSSFPNSIIIAANSEETEGSEGRNPWRVEKAKGGGEFIVIPENPMQASVVDGQHRLYSFIHSELSERKNFELLCSVFFDITSTTQAYIFATINTNQKMVRRGMALNLYGYNTDDEPNDIWSPEKLAVFITRRLNFDEESKLYRRIKIDAEGAEAPKFLPGATRAVPLAAVVDGILGLISRKPKDDRELLRSERQRLFTRIKRDELPEDSAPLRSWYREAADQSIYSLVREFVALVDRETWATSAEGSMLTRAVGIRAIFEALQHFLAQLKPNVPSAKKPPDYAKLLAPVGTALRAARKVDFSDPYFEATGRGQQRIRFALLFAAGWTPLSGLPEKERESIQALVRAK